MTAQPQTQLPIIRLKRNGNQRLNCPIFLMLLPVDDRFQPGNMFDIQVPDQVKFLSIKAKIIDAFIYEQFELLSPALLRLVTGNQHGEDSKATYRKFFRQKYDLNTQKFGLYFFQKLTDQ